MRTRLGISISKDNAFLGNCVSPELNSSEVVPRAYKYNGSPNYTSNNIPSKESEKPVFTQYNGSPNYTTAVATIDWLSITFRVSLPSKDEEFTEGSWMDASGRLGIKLDNRHVPHYRYFGKCFLDGVQFGEVSFCPYENSVLQKDFASLRIDNELFYSNEWYGYVNEFKTLTDAVINNVSRLDIAVDYSGVQGKKILDFVKDVKFGNSPYRKLGVKNLKYTSQEGYDDYFTVGKRGADKSAVFYNKSLEIRDESSKEYISNYHRSNGLDPDADVYRFEMRFKSEALKSIVGFSLEQLLETDYLVCLIKTHIKNWFEFVLSIAVNVSRVERFNLLKLETVSFAVDYLDRVRRQVKINARGTKMTIKRLIKDIFMDGGKGAFLVDTVKHYITVSKLGDWLEYRFEGMIKEFNKEFRFICTPAISVEELARLIDVNYTAPVISKQAVA